LRRLSEGQEVAVGACIAAFFALLIFGATSSMLIVYLTGYVLVVVLGQYLLFLLGTVVPVVTGLSVGVVGGLLFRALLMTGAPLARWRSQ
jgi:hypothetical protein